MLQLHVWRLSLLSSQSSWSCLERHDDISRSSSSSSSIMHLRLKRRAEPVVVAPLRF